MKIELPCRVLNACFQSITVSGIQVVDYNDIIIFSFMSLFYGYLCVFMGIHVVSTFSVIN